MNAVAASPAVPMAAPPPAVKHGVSDTLGVYKFVKGTAYYPLQWLAGMTALYILEGGAPTPNMINKLAAVRAFGVTANATMGDAIKNGIPVDLGLKPYKTPTENLYGLHLPTYAFQRTAYAASVAMWPTIFAVGMTLAMPYAAPAFVAMGGSLTSAGLALGNMAMAASAHSALLAGIYQVGEGATLLIGAAMQTWPAAFAMKEGVAVLDMAISTAQRIFLINLVAGTLADIVGLEKLNPYHKWKATRGEAPAPPSK